MKNSFYVQNIERISKNNNTPYFVIFEEILKKNHSFLKRSFSGIPTAKIYYSIKTNFESYLLSALRNLGLDAEVCGELDMTLAERAGFKKQNIIFDACCKTEKEIRSALSWDIHLFNVESEEEINFIDRIAGDMNKKAKIGLRIDFRFLSFNPVNLSMKSLQKKFGLEAGKICDIARSASTKKHIEIRGLMAHNNNPCKKARDYSNMLKKLFLLALQLNHLNINIEEINIGGGLPGVQEEQKISKIASEISEEYIRLSKRYCYSPVLVIEPGRALVENAVILVGRILRVEEKRAFCDISINDLGYKFTFKEKNFFILDSGINNGRRVRISIYGPTLNPYDRLFLLKDLPALHKDDTLVILNAGAYTIPCSTQFMRPRPAVFFVNSQGESKLIRRRETAEDILATQDWSL